MSTGINIASSSGLTVGTTAVTSGTDGRVFFQAGGVIQQDAGFLWDTTNKRMQLLGTGVIASPALNSVLEIKAKNGLSDIAFRVRNSADSADIFSVRGNGEMYIPNVTSHSSNTIYFDSSKSIIKYTNDVNSCIALGQNATFSNGTFYTISIGNNATTGALGGASIAIGNGTNSNGGYCIAIGENARTAGSHAINIGTGGATQYSGTNSIHLGKKGNLGNNFTIDNVFITYFNSDYGTTVTKSNGSLGLIGQQKFFHVNGSGLYGIDNVMGNGGNTLVVRNHTSVPSLNITDSFQLYSNDITAGNAAPHFRTENGAIVKVYQETTAVAASTLVSNAGTNITDTDTFDGYTLKQIVKALRNQGLLA